MSVTACRGRIAVFGSGYPLAPSDTLYAEARALGRLLAEAGFEVATGGYDGAMAAVSQGARDAGGHVIGVTLTLFDPEPPNPWLTEERRVGTFAERLATLNQHVRAQTPWGIEAGIATGVDENGALWLERADGSTVQLIAGDVTLVKSQGG